MFASLSRRIVVAGAAASALAGPASAAVTPDRRTFDDSMLGDLHKRIGGRFGFYAVNVASRRYLAVGADERFPMCSTFKAMAVAAALSRVDAGAEHLDRFVRYAEADLLSYAPVTKEHVADGGMRLADLCAAAIELSDNTAANLILAAIGGPAGWTDFVRTLGDKASRLDRTEPALNTARAGDPRDTTTPAAMARDLRAVLLGHALSPTSRDRLAGWMVDCKTGQTRLRSGFPSGWRIADKTGSGDHGTSNDIAVAWGPHATLVMACYLTGGEASTSADRDAAISFMAGMAAHELGDG